MHAERLLQSILCPSLRIRGHLPAPTVNGDEWKTKTRTHGANLEQSHERPDRQDGVDSQGPDDWRHRTLRSLSWRRHRAHDVVDDDVSIYSEQVRVTSSPVSGSLPETAHARVRSDPCVSVVDVACSGPVSENKCFTRARATPHRALEF